MFTEYISSTPDTGPIHMYVICYVICWPGGPYWEKLFQRSWPRAQFFPIWTNLGWQITCLLFSSVEYFVSSFCVEFSLHPFSNLMYAYVFDI